MTGQHPGHLHRSRGELHHDGHGRGRRPRPTGGPGPGRRSSAGRTSTRTSSSSASARREIGTPPSVPAGVPADGASPARPGLLGAGGRTAVGGPPGSPAPGPAPRALSDVVHVGRAWGGQVGADDGTTKGRMQPGGGGGRPEGIGSTGLRGPGPNRRGGQCDDQGVETAPGPAPVRRGARSVRCGSWSGPRRPCSGAVGRGTTATSADGRAALPAPGGQRLRPGPGRADTRASTGAAPTPWPTCPATRTASCRAGRPGRAADSPVVAGRLPRQQRLQRRRDGRPRLLRRALPGLGVPGMVGRRDGGRHRAGGLRLGRRGHADSRTRDRPTLVALIEQYMVTYAGPWTIQLSMTPPSGSTFDTSDQLQRHRHRHLGDRQRGRRARSSRRRPPAGPGPTRSPTSSGWRAQPTPPASSPSSGTSTGCRPPSQGPSAPRTSAWWAAPWAAAPPTYAAPTGSGGQLMMVSGASETLVHELRRGGGGAGTDTADRNHRHREVGPRSRLLRSGGRAVRDRGRLRQRAADPHHRRHRHGGSVRPADGVGLGDPVPGARVGRTPRLRPGPRPGGHRLPHTVAAGRRLLHGGRRGAGPAGPARGGQDRRPDRTRRWPAPPSPSPSTPPTTATTTRASARAPPAPPAPASRRRRTRRGAGWPAGTRSPRRRRRRATGWTRPRPPRPSSSNREPPSWPP